MPAALLFYICTPVITHYKLRVRKLYFILINTVYQTKASVPYFTVLGENLSSGFPTRSDTNPAVQPQKMARGLKFWIYEAEGLYYLCSKNKDAYQLQADLCLCFCVCISRFSHDAAQILQQL